MMLKLVVVSSHINDKRRPWRCSVWSDVPDPEVYDLRPAAEARSGRPMRRGVFSV